MTNEEAKRILAIYRPGTDDERDPMFAEALELARSNRELKAWLNESMAFDQSMRAVFGRVTAPADVREAILAEHKIIRPSPWWERRLTGREMAAAAAVFLAATLVGLWAAQPPTSFAEFRREMADQSWGPSPHVESKSTDLAAVWRFLASRQVATNFTLPPILAHQSDIRGCSLMHWKGREVPVICFSSKGQHLHLLVVDRSLFPDAPNSIPEMDRWQAARTASWSKDDHSYVLTGLSTPTFVKKFRKARRWDWES